MSNQKTFDVNIEGVQKFLIGLDRFTEYVRFLPNSVWDDVAEIFFENEEKIFNSEGHPHTFVPLSPGYAEWKEQHYPGMPIMQRTGLSKEALTGKGATPGHAVPVKKIINQRDARGITLGVRSPFLPAHQKGLGHLPKREVIQVTAFLRLQYAKVLQKGLVYAERSSWGLMNGST